MGFFGFLFFSFVILLSGCQEPVDLQKALNQSQPPPLPVMRELTYQAQGATQTLRAPLENAIVLRPDFQTGICANVTNTAELTFLGIFSESRVQNIEAIGISQQNLSLSGDTFRLQVCVPQGSSSIRIVATSESNKQSDEQVFSVSLTPSMGTIGFGLAKYPNPGFRVESTAARPESLTSEGSPWTAQAISMSSMSVYEKRHSSLSLSLGFVPVLKEVQP